MVGQQRPDLQSWHRAPLDAEFTAATAPAASDLHDCPPIEDALVGQLETQVYARTPPEQRRFYIRYAARSLSDPRGQTPDLNRTLERRPPQPRGAALLLHGLTDSPYSLPAGSEVPFQQGLSVLALRLPGHGAAPFGLLEATYADWTAAVRTGMRHLAATLDEGQSFDVDSLLQQAITEVRGRLVDAPAMPVGLTLLTNAARDGGGMVALRRRAASTQTRRVPLELSRPRASIR